MAHEGCSLKGGEKKREKLFVQRDFGLRHRGQVHLKVDAIGNFLSQSRDDVRGEGDQRREAKHLAINNRRSGSPKPLV